MPQTVNHLSLAFEAEADPVTLARTDRWRAAGGCRTQEIQHGQRGGSPFLSLLIWINSVYLIRLAEFVFTFHFFNLIYFIKKRF